MLYYDIISVREVTDADKTTVSKDFIICDYWYFLYKDLKFQPDHYVASVRIRSFSGPSFPACRLNMERYKISLHIKSKYGKTWTGKTPNMGTFHAVDVCNGYHDVLMMFMNLSDISILNIHGVDYLVLLAESTRVRS